MENIENKDEYVPLSVKTLAGKVSPILPKLIPGFMIRHFEKLLHFEELNEHFLKYHNATGVEFLDGTVERLDLHNEFYGAGTEEFVKNNGKSFMVVSNHPYGGPESIVLMQVLVHICPEIKLVAQSFLKFIKPLNECSVFNKAGARTLLEHIKEHKPICMYPAGYCSRVLSFKDVFDYEWKPSFIKIAKKNNMPIVVVFTDGHVSKRTLNWTKFRNFFHIKASIETMYLPDELFLMQHSTVKMTVGKTIDPSVFTDDVDNVEWAARLRQYCYELKSNPDAVFDPSKPATLPLK